MFLYALCNGWIGEGTTVVEASSGSTAVRRLPAAYFAALLGLPFIAVKPATTSAAKVKLIESQGGRCHFVPAPSQVYAEAQRVAQATGEHYLDQFTNAERATDWRGNNNIAESIYEQMRDEKYPLPVWIVVGAGTGGTSATIGRYIRYRRHALRHRDAYVIPHRGHRPVAGGAVVSARRGRLHGRGPGRGVYRRCPAPRRRPGTSTGTNLWGAFGLLAEMVAQGCSGSVVTLLADNGDRYEDTYFDDEWVRAQGLDPTGPAEALVEFERSCRWNRPVALRFGESTGRCDRLSWLQAGCGAAW